MRTSAEWVLVGLFILVHFSAHPLLATWPAGPDLLACGLLLGSLQLRAGPAAGFGFILGLLEASMALGGLGPTMVIFTLAGYAGARLRDLLYSDSARFIPSFLFIGIWVVQLLIAATTAWPPELRLLLVHAPLSAAGSALLYWLSRRAIGVFLG